MKLKVFAAGASLALLAGCVQPGPGQAGYAPPGTLGANNTTGGTLLGAGAGALAGNQFGHGSGKLATTVLGGILGAFAGNSIGRSIDENDLRYAHRASQQAFESGPSNKPVRWQNPDNGNYGTITPQTAYDANGTVCREYQQTIVVGGQPQNAYGRACRQPDGSWKVEN
jgi:surface antigen